MSSTPQFVLMLGCSDPAQAERAYTELLKAQCTLRLSFIPEIKTIISGDLKPIELERQMVLALVDAKSQAGAVAIIEHLIPEPDLTVVPIESVPPTILCWLYVEPERDLH
jgi:hypothetical protein